MKRSPEEVVVDLQRSAASRFYDENLTDLLQEAAHTIEALNKLRVEEMQGAFRAITEEMIKDVPGMELGEVEVSFAEEDMLIRKQERPTKAQRHEMICHQLTAIYEAKNHDYGDSFARVRGMHPEAICIRLWDKLLRLESLMHGKTAKVDESIEDTLKDLANYAIMELVERRVSEDDEQ